MWVPVCVNFSLFMTPSTLLQGTSPHPEILCFVFICCPTFSKETGFLLGDLGSSGVVEVLLQELFHILDEILCICGKAGDLLCLLLHCLLPSPFISLFHMFLGMFSWFHPVWTLWAPWTWMAISFPTLWKIFTIIYSKFSHTLLIPFLLPSSFVTFMILLFLHLMLFLDLCDNPHFFLFFFSLSLPGFIISTSQFQLIICPSAS